MKTDVIVKDDNRIKLLTNLLTLTDFPEREQSRRPHQVHRILNETRDYLEKFKDHQAVKFLKENINETPLYFLYAYVVSLNWPGLEPSGFPDYLYEYEPNLINSAFNVYIKDFYEQSNLNQLWEKHRLIWDEVCMDTIKCFEGINYKDLLEKFFGKINYNLVFYPNILLPQLFSSGASSPKELYCIARMPGPVYLNENLLKFSEDSVWVNIVAFHEFCHPLLDFVFRNKKEDIIRSKEIGSKLAVFDLYKEHYPMWEDLFSELLIYSMTIVFLRQNISLVEAEKFTKESEDKTGIKLYSKTADLLEEYLVLNHQGKYKTINEYFGILVEKLIN